MRPVQQTFLFGTTNEPEGPVRRNLVIEAGAGTGKTTAIVAEVLKLMLERENLAPERIVLMTFTEKAAGEIADRIRLALEELAQQLAVGGLPLAVDPSSLQSPTANRQPILWPIGSPHALVEIEQTERAGRAIAHHLTNIDSLRSQTIHSFCQSLLRSFPIEAGLDPQFKIIEGFERSLLHGQVYDAWVDEETRVHPTEEIVRQWELLFAHVGYLFVIRDLVLDLLDRRDLLEETGYDFGDFSEVVPALEDAVSAIRRCGDDAGDDQARKIFSYIRETEPPWGGPLDGWIEYLQPVAGNIREANLPKHGVLKEALKILRSGDKGRCIHDRLVSHRAAMALLSLTRRFIAYLDAEKRKLGVVDFDDLLLRTLALLDEPAVLARARSQLDFIFVDEFQDTDRTQARIIDRLARDESGAYVAGKTIVVGDPKQSIYGFRRADPETYDRTAGELVRGGAHQDRLAAQYRSDAPLLDVVNAMFSRLFPETLHDPNVFRPSYKPLSAARTTPRRELDARITLLHTQHDEKSDRFLVEAHALAEWIHAHRDGRDLDLQRFAILFRRLTKIDDYLDTLDRYGIDYVLPPTRMFLDRRAPVDLLAVLRAIAFPFDAGAQISAARTPYFALTDVEVVSGGDPWQAFVQSINAFRASSRHLTVSSLIDLVIDTTGITPLYGAAADGIRHMRHLEHVRSIAFEYDMRIGGSARQFVDEISRRRVEPEEVEPSLVDESKNAVRIMSVHGAKGLEFDTVILPDLSVQPPSNDGLFTVEKPRSLVMTGRVQSISANFRYTADDQKLKRLARSRDEAETQRLFYVAVTRARTDVVFVCNAGEKKPAGFHRCLLDVLAVDQSTLATMWPESGREVRDTSVGPIAFEKVGVQGTAVRARRRLRDGALEAELAASEIVPFETPFPITEASLSMGEIAARRAGSRNRPAGILLHRLLELWDGRADVDPLLRQLAVDSAADDQAVTRVSKRLARMARSPMLQRIARAETVGREFPVRFVEGGTLVERRIDRLIRENGSEVVIDYKSGAPDPIRVEKDRQQVTRYCRAIAGMTGRPCRGVIWYVDLERDEIVEI